MEIRLAKKLRKKKYDLQRRKHKNKNQKTKNQKIRRHKLERKNQKEKKTKLLGQDEVFKIEQQTSKLRVKKKITKITSKCYKEMNKFRSILKYENKK